MSTPRAAILPTLLILSACSLAACSDVDVVLRRTGGGDPLDLAPRPERAPLGPVRTVAVAEDRTCAIDAAGVVLCWGLDLLSSTWGAVALTPVPVPGVDGASELGLSEAYACATSDAGIQCWGHLPWDAMDAAPTSPTLLAGSSGARRLHVSAGRVCAIVGPVDPGGGAAPGVVRCWGTMADAGACFSDAPAASAEPFDLPGVDDATRVNASGSATCFTRASGDASCFLAPDGAPGQFVPLDLGDVRSLYVWESDGCYVGGNVFCGVLADGRVDCRFGFGLELDPGAVTIHHGAPAAKELVWSDLSPDDVCVLTEADNLFCSGAPGGIVLDATAVAMASSHACAIQDAVLSCWGSNAWGALGIGVPARRSAAKPVAGLTDVVSLDAGADHTCATRETGDVLCWGSNAGGQRGWSSGPVDATYHPRWDWFPDGGELSALPRAVDGVAPASRVFADQYRTCVTSIDGAVTCWGQDLTQVLSLASPTNIDGIASATNVSVGDDSQSCAVVGSGGVSCWGRGWYGTRVGVEPLSLPGPAISVDGDTYEACALLASGDVYCWGGYVPGSIGAAGDPLSPKKRDGIQGAIDLSEGCVVTASHDLVCWFFPWAGDLVPDGVPTVVASGVRDVDGPCVVRDDGAVACFVDFGALDGDVGAFQQVPGVADAIQVTTGAQHACALRSTGDVVCWGSAATGRLGDGSATAFPHPVPVRGSW